MTNAECMGNVSTEIRRNSLYVVGIVTVLLCFHVSVKLKANIMQYCKCAL